MKNALSLLIEGGFVGEEKFALVAASVDKPVISNFDYGCSDLKHFCTMALRVHDLYYFI